MDIIENAGRGERQQMAEAIECGAFFGGTDIDE